ncbi:SNG2 protein, partial [Atractosteus spatula]|nr:SNG2 protein [Atractosteus spatula]
GLKRKMETGAYGAAKAGGAFDFPTFLKQPQTIIRFLSWVFAIVVFASITGEGYVNTAHDKETSCMFNENDSACHYGVGVGVLAFLGCVAFFILDAYFPQISNANDRKYIVMADLAFSGVWTLLWFVGFCFLTNQWSQTTEKEHLVGDAARASITFSFFSIFTWGLLSYLALKRYRQGVDDFSQNYTDPSSDHTTPYPPYPTASDSYQQSPFDSNPQPAAEGAYQPPVY